MEFRILGPVEVVDDHGRLSPLGPPRQQALLVALLLHPGEPVSVERLIDLLWSHKPPRTAATIVHGSIAGLRRALDSRNRSAAGHLLRTRPGGYVLEIASKQLDASRFEDLVGEGRRHVRTHPDRASATLARALAMWRGPACAGATGDFVRNAAARLEELRLDALEARLEADVALGRHAHIISELEALVTAHPLRERLWAQLMTALYRNGRQADALAAYQAVLKILDEELGVLPGPELRDLEHAILEHHPSLEAPGMIRGRPRLPAPLDSFIGRETEQRDLAALIADNRLVAVVGAAGVGKTRLALQVARTISNRFSGGVWFVDLAPLSTPDLLAQTVADRIGVRAEPGVALPDTIAAAMASREALLIIDNCEHVVDACASFVETVLRAGSGVRVLATSREPLGLTGEALFSLTPLPVAPADRPWEEIAASEAVWLFGARAAAAWPGFRVTEANIGLVRDICHQLDGLPLALELAAAHVRALSLRDISVRLDQRFRLLDTRSSAGHGRHRTLTAAVDWSYELLHAPERLLFERLSAFANGFTLDSAERVGTDESLASSEVAALLSQLVSRSLVQLEHVLPDQARYRMLEPLRHYARVRLQASGGEGATLERHARYFVARVEEVGPHLFRRGSGPRLERLRAENENLRAVLEWSLSPAGDAHLGARLVAVLWHPWDLSGARIEGMHWVDAAAQAVSASYPKERMPLLAAGALLQLGLGNLEGAAAFADEQFDLAGVSDDRRWLGDALTRQGIIAWARGDLPGAKLLYGRAVETLAEADDMWRTALARVHLARALRDEGKLTEARQMAEESLTEARHVGENTVVGFALDVLGSIAHELGQSDYASHLVEDALINYRAVQYREGEASALQLAGRMLLQRGDAAAAGQNLRNALEVCHQIGHRGGVATSLQGVAAVMAIVGRDLDEALFLGAAAARQAEIGVLAPSRDRLASDAARVRLISALDANEMERAWRQGADMSVEDLLQLIDIVLRR